MDWCGAQQCLKLEPDDRPTCSHLLKHELFTADGFAASFTRQLRGIICREYESNPLTAQTMRHRYERCRQQLGLQPTGDHPQLTDNDDLRQRNKVTNELSQRLVRYCSVEDATLEGAVCCR